MMRNLFVICFLVVSIINILSLLFSVNGLFEVTKPLIVLLLLAHYITHAQARSMIVIGALVFCLAGDVLLLFTVKNELFFMGGLAAFLAGHILYVSSYRQHQNAEGMEVLLSTQRIHFAMPIVLAGTGLIVILFPALGSMKLPVTLYAVVLMVMAITALMRYGKTTRVSFWFVFSGALLFMISDSALAVNKFLHPFDHASVIIMVTYITAQYLIVEGIVRHPAK